VLVLIVEDDPATRDLLERGLRDDLFHTESVGDGWAAEREAVSGRFDAIVLDVVLPDHDGFTVCRRLRAQGVDTPILLLTGRTSLDARVHGLDSGADDYLEKPFAFEELLARLRAITRRGRTRTLQATLRFGPIELHRREHLVTVHGERIVMTATEFRLLEYLLLRGEGLVTREELAVHVWSESAARDSNVIDVYISYLRKKLKGAGPVLKTVRGVGYTLEKGPAGDHRPSPA